MAAAPYYLEAPKGDEYQPSFLDKVGNGLSRFWDQTTPEAFASLAQAFLTPGKPFAAKLGLGLAGLGQEVAANKKKQGLAAAFDQMLSTVPEAQRPIFDMLRQQNPEVLMNGMAAQMFAKPNEPTSDIQNYQFAVQQGFPGTYFDFKKALAQAGAGVQGVDIPGMGTIDPKTGATLSPGSAPALPPSPMPQPSRGAPVPPPASVVKPDRPGVFFDPAMHPELGDGMTPPPLNSADFPPSAPSKPMQYKPVLGAQQNALGLAAAPQGSQWVFGPDNKPMLQPVEGFKAAPTQVPAEIGARIGLAEGFLKKYADIYKKLPELDSLVGRGQIAFNTGTAAEVKRHIETGAEALIRSLTGAGKSKEEAESYASRYLPSPFDTAFDLKSKLEGLKYDLENSIAGTMKDRGGWTSPATTPEPSKEDLEFTAKKYGISVEEVKRRLKNAN